MNQKTKLSKFHQDWSKLVDKASSNYNSLTRDERIWFNVQSLITDVNNGGLISHYYNSGADKNKETIEDLNTLGYKDIAKLLEKINKLFTKGHVPKDITERNSIISSWSEGQHDDLLYELNKEFYEKEKDLTLGLVEHIKKKRLYKTKRIMKRNANQTAWENYNYYPAFLTGTIAFFIIWGYLISEWGGLGIAMGWLPAIIGAIIAAFLWEFLWQVFGDFLFWIFIHF